jgi:hypothetical protein
MRTFILIPLAFLLATSCNKDYTAVKKTITAELLSAKSGGGSTVNISKDLVAFYPFDGNAKDLSGNGYDGINDGATNTTNRFGQKIEHLISTIIKSSLISTIPFSKVISQLTFGL